jgi:multiple sugar transport system substrate-binding protein
MQTLYDLVHKYKAIPMEVLQWDVDGTFQGVQAGRAAMVTWATHRVVTAREGAGVGDNLLTAPVPSFNAAKPSPGHVTGWNLAMTANTTNKDLAWKFIDHMTNTEAQKLNAKIAGELPSRKSAYQDPWFKESKLGADMTQWKEYLEKAGRVPLFPKDYLFLHRVIAEAAQEIVLNNSPIQKALDEAAAKYNKQAGF